MTQDAPAAGEGLKYNLQQLLRAMVEKGASDMHISAGSPPLLRIDGTIVPLKLPLLSKTEAKQLCYEMLTEDQKIAFEKKNELDLVVPACAALSRFRANIFMQRGAVGGAFRQIPFKILELQARARPAAGRGQDREQAARPRARHGPDRLGQEHDAREHHRQDQHGAAAPHHDDRGSGRVHPREQELPREPARDRERHGVVQGRR